MKRGLLLIDRGSREKEVRDELDFICDKVKQIGDYSFANYCFLEVLPPFIEEGITNCLKTDIDALTIVPYFLYPGKKVKAAVSEAIKFQAETSVKFTVTKPMSMHKTMVDIIDSKIETALAKNNTSLPKGKVDVLVIGHGSKDPNAQISIKYVVDNLAPKYRNINYCFLEIEEPNLNPAIEKSNIKKFLITEHIGTDDKMINFIIERAKEVEHAN